MTAAIQQDKKQPEVGLSLMLEEAYLRAAFPLFEAGEVDVLEWSFDTGWGQEPVPQWADELLAHYSENHALIGHGVTYSALSAQWTQRQVQWLDMLSHEVRKRQYRHISEHFGFSTGGSFHQSAPLPVPRTPETLAVGHDRLLRLAEVAQVPIGLENLAFAFGPCDVRQQGPFIEELLEPVDGFLLLDLHNIYCQMCNFDCSPSELLHSYPLERVRELHVSGGSWSEPQLAGNSGRIRRDTHDEAVPDDVFELLTLALKKCPKVDVVIFERLGDTFKSESDMINFAEDYRRLRQVVVEGCHV